jgi:putative phosphoribosyl transferase
LNPEYAIGAAGPDFYFTLPHSDVTEQYIVEEKHRVQEKLKTYELKLRGKKKPQSPEGKKIIIIDDGIATGLTLRAAIEMVRKNNPLSITVAVPVISEKAARMLEQESIELITLLIPDYFTGVGAFYAHFDQVEDEEVIRLLLESANIEGT